MDNMPAAMSGIMRESMSETLLLVPDAQMMADGDARRICSPATGPIAIFRNGDEYFAVSDRCTHGDASLAEGWLEGYEIECPIHAGRFDIRTGAALAFPVTEAVATYPTRWVHGLLYVVLAQ